MKLFNFFQKKIHSLGKTIVWELGQSKGTPHNYEALIKESYVINPIIYFCANLIATHAAEIPFVLFKNDKIIEEHDLLTLINRPNPFQGQIEFFETIFADYVLSGNSYIEATYGFKPGEMAKEDYSFRDEPPIHLYEKKPQHMSLESGATGLPTLYKFERNSVKVIFPVNIEGKSNIMHCKKYNPTDDGYWVGMTPLKPSAYSIDQHNAASSHNFNLLKNGGRPSGAITVKDKDGKPRTLTDKQKKEAERYLDQFVFGTTNSGRYLLLDGGMEWIELGKSLKDMDYTELKKMVASEAALVFNVPMDLINTKQAKYNNLAASYEQFYANAVLPVFKRHINELNYWLVPRYGDKSLKLGFDDKDVFALMNRRIKQRESFEKVSYMTDNEKRKAVGLDSKEGGDELYKPFNLVPIDQLGTQQANQEAKKYSEELIKNGIDAKRAKKIAELIYL
jgi:HK97 family phage portal protein